MLILSVACAVAGSVAVNAADPVYSVNAVGYVNVTCPHGFSIIANPLIAGTNKLSTLIPNPPIGTTVYEFDSKYKTSTFEVDDFGNLGWSNDLDLSPGTGAWIYNTSNDPFVITFVGEVAQNTVTNQINAGFSLKSSIIPQAGQLDGLLGYPVSKGDVVYLFRDGKYLYFVYEVDDFGNLNWSNVPTPNVGEGFWIWSSTAKVWSRTFDINK